jgi:hypothetical protein
MYSMPAILNENEGFIVVRHLFEGRVWTERIKKEDFEKRILEFYGVPYEELSSYLFEMSKMFDTDDSVGSHYALNGEIIPIGEKPKSTKAKKQIKQKELII